MKLILALALLTLASCAHKDAAKYCLDLDAHTGLARCETAEVVCYVSSGGQQCWPKPPVAPTPTPKAEEKPIVKKK